jgi:glycosyltransferase involved in cell wall biosynthesis
MAEPDKMRSGVASRRTSEVRKVVFVCYGAFDCNSAGHIAGFANGLVGLGHSVAVCAAGEVDGAYEFGPPSFEFFTLKALARAPEAVVGFDGSFEPDQTVIVCWTPRENVRRTVQPIAARYSIPYVVHLEDNEEHLADLKRSRAKRWRFRGRALGGAVTDPEQFTPFLTAARGLTLIEGRLKELVPPDVPAIVLEPGVDLVALGSEMPPHRRATIRSVVGSSDKTAMLVYPGNVHQANAEEVASLYAAVEILRARGRDLVLVRTGSDFARAPFLKQAGPERGIISLGRVERHFLIDLMKSADLFVQPGKPGPFNDYRLPSKLPEFMAIGRPIVLPATNVGSRLEHGRDALLLTEGTAEEIAGMIELVLSDESLAERLGSRVKAFAARHYDPERQVATLAGFLNRIV